MLKELLEQNEYQTKQAYSGTEAKIYMEQKQPAAVILDVMLPGMNGEQLLAWIKKEIPTTSVLVASAKDEVKTRISLLREGADDYIEKTFDTEELTARLEAVLRRSSMGKETEESNAGSQSGKLYKKQ